MDCVIGCLTTNCFDSINNEVVSDDQQLIMFDCEDRHSEYNHSTRTAFNRNLCVWALRYSANLSTVIFRTQKAE